MTMRRMFAAALLLALPCGPALATTYYIDAETGADTKAGTSPVLAWASLARANRAVLRPGDTLLLHGGQHFSGPLVLGSRDGGDPERLVSVTSYGGGRATITSTRGDGIAIDQTQGIRITALIVVGAGAARDSGIGVHARAAGDGPRLDTVQLARIDVSGFRGGGVVFNASGFGGFAHVLIDEIAAHDNGDAGIHVLGRYVRGDEGALPYSNAHVTVTRSTAYRNKGDPATGQNTGSGILLGQVEDGTISLCTAYENGGLGRNVGGGPVGIWAYDSTRITIERNASYGNRSQPAGHGPDGDGFDLDGGTTDSVVQYNYSHGNQGSGYLLTQFANARPFSGNIIRFNISEDDATGIGSYAAPGTTVARTQFNNNTVYTVRAANAVQILPSGAYDHLAFRNNILSGAGRSPLIDSPITAGLAFQGNLYWSPGGPFAVRWGGVTYTSLAQWRAAAGVERLGAKPTGQQADPRLVSPGQGGIVDARHLRDLAAYHLLDGSPATGAGLDLHALFGTPKNMTDFYRRQLDQRALPVGAAVK